jgi:hypothetical protein
VLLSDQYGKSGIFGKTSITLSNSNTAQSKDKITGDDDEDIRLQTTASVLHGCAATDGASDPGRRARG